MTDTAMTSAAAIRGFVVPHTHWDREWYRSFQEFRFKLVGLLDTLLDLMEADPRFTHFVLDGQMAVVDDYLEIRPEAAQRLESLARAGRISMGPWYILMDEFLVSGETIIRDLQLGMERAGDFGGAMKIGYLPDMFGHIAQMPQILRLAGFERAVVWRGVPRRVDAARFRWSAPDGSTVLAEYLVRGYGNAAALPSDPLEATELVRAYKAQVDALGSARDELGHELPEAATVGNGRRSSAGAASTLAEEKKGKGWGDGLLLMNGTDHQMPRAWLGEVISRVNSLGNLELEVSSLAEALEAISPGGLAKAPQSLVSVSGELRSSARANLLMGVASNRVDVKQAAARAERSLERRAEPLWALFAEASEWPEPFFGLAWRQLILNSAHDSSCACSVDEVVEAVLNRYYEARQISDALAGEIEDRLARSFASSGAHILNLSAHSRRGVVTLDLPGDAAATGDPEGCQVVSRRPEILLETTIDGDLARTMMAEVNSQQVSDDTFIVEIDVSETDHAIEVSLRASDTLERELALAPIKERLAQTITSSPGKPVHILMTQDPKITVLSRTSEVPGFGWSRWSPTALDDPVEATATGRGLSNGLLRVEVDPDDGTFSVDSLAGFDRLVDGGDQGDTYNYSPPAHDFHVDRPSSVELRMVEGGPVRGVIEVTRRFDLPEAIDDATGSRVGSRPVEVVSRISLHAGEKLVRVDCELDNSCLDHRLRTLFPLPQPARASYAECAFAVVERPLVAEGGPTEKGLATYPSRRFVSSGGLTVFHEGLLEYELVAADGSSIVVGPEGEVPPAAFLALTLLRATGMLSRLQMSYRPLPAGPFIPTRGSQVQGRHHLRYGVLVGDCDPYAVCDDFQMPLEAVIGTGEGHRPGTGRALSVDGAEVSALRRSRRGGELELRVFNPTAEAVVARVKGEDGEPCAGHIVDLTGRILDDHDGTVELQPWQILTLKLEDHRPTR